MNFKNLIIILALLILTKLTIYSGYYDKVTEDRKLTHYISNQKEAEKLLKKTKDLVYKVIGIKVYGNIKLKMVSAQELDNLIGNSPYKGVEIGLYRWERDGHHIYMIKNLLNEDAFISTLAHEYTHAWQQENCRFDQSLPVKEGLAQWVAYKVCNYIKAYKQASKIYFMTDPVYGVGFKNCLQLETKLGKDKFIEKIKNLKNF